MTRYIILTSICLCFSLSSSAVDWIEVKDLIKSNTAYLRNLDLFDLTSADKFVSKLLDRFKEEKNYNAGRKGGYVFDLKKHSEVDIVISERGNLRFIFDRKLFFNCAVMSNKKIVNLSFSKKSKILPINSFVYVLTVPFSIDEDIEIPATAQFKRFDFAKKSSKYYSLNYGRLDSWEKIKRSIENNKTYSKNLGLFDLRSERKFVYSLLTKFRQKLQLREKNYYLFSDEKEEVTVLVSKKGRLRLSFSETRVFECELCARKKNEEIDIYFWRKSYITEINKGYKLTVLFSIHEDVKIPNKLHFKKIKKIKRKTRDYYDDNRITKKQKISRKRGEKIVFNNQITNYSNYNDFNPSQIVDPNFYVQDYGFYQPMVDPNFYAQVYEYYPPMLDPNFYVQGYEYYPLMLDPNFYVQVYEYYPPIVDPNYYMQNYGFYPQSYYFNQR